MKVCAMCMRTQQKRVTCSTCLPCKVLWELYLMLPMPSSGHCIQYVLTACHSRCLGDQGNWVCRLPLLWVELAPRPCLQGPSICPGYWARLCTPGRPTLCRALPRQPLRPSTLPPPQRADPPKRPSRSPPSAGDDHSSQLPPSKSRAPSQGEEGSILPADMPPDEARSLELATRP